MFGTVLVRMMPEASRRAESRCGRPGVGCSARNLAAASGSGRRQGGFVASDRLGRARVTRCAAHAVVVRALFMLGPLSHGCSPEVRAVRGFSLIGRAGWRGPCGNGRPAVMRSSESGISEPARPRRAINFGA